MTDYNPQGQLSREIDASGVSTLYQYNDRGEREFVAGDRCYPDPGYMTSLSLGTMPGVAVGMV